jgi:zinc-ribbon domain/Sel1 repeat
VICSACGHDIPAGYHFCGMCGTPLPHRPLETPGAHSTMSLARGPLEIPRPVENQSAAVADSSDQRSQADAVSVTAGAYGNESSPPDKAVSPEVTHPADEALKPFLVETPEQHTYPESGSLPSRTSVPEDPRELFAGTLEHAEQSSRSERTQTSGVVPAMPSEVVAFADALAIPAAEAPPPAEAPHFQWMDEVLDEIEVEAAKAAARQDEQQSPNFVDELALREFEPSPVAPSEAPPPYLKISAAPTVPSPARIRVKEPRSGNWRIVVAYAAAVVFAAVVLLQWRSYRNQTDDGPIDIIERRIQAWMPDNEEDANSDQPGAASGSGTSASTPSPQTEQPSQPQNQSPAEKTQSPKPGPAAANPSPASNSPIPTVPSSAAQSVPSAGEKPKPLPPPAQDKEPEVAIKGSVPGAAEMAKAKHASDAAAQAAWLWKATAKGNPDAPVLLADMYIKGEGVPRSCDQAVVLLKTAAVNEDVRACNRLASMYATGVCVPRSHVETYRWLSSALAADPNSQWARQNRDLTWQQMTPEERALAEKYR